MKNKRTNLYDRAQIIRALRPSVTPVTCVGYIAGLIHRTYPSINARECVAQAILEYNSAMEADIIILGDELNFIEKQIA